MINSPMPSVIFLTALGLWMTVAYLSPSHYLTSESIGAFGLNIVNQYYIGNHKQDF